MTMRLPIYLLFIILFSSIATATLDFTGNTWVPQCAPGTQTIRDFAIDPNNQYLYLMLSDGTLEIDNVSAGPQTPLTCDSTTTGITTQQVIEFKNGLLLGNSHYYNLTYPGGFPALTDLGVGSYSFVTTGSGVFIQPIFAGNDTLLYGTTIGPACGDTDNGVVLFTIEANQSITIHPNSQGFSKTHIAHGTPNPKYAFANNGVIAAVADLNFASTLRARLSSYSVSNFSINTQTTTDSCGGLITLHQPINTSKPLALSRPGSNTNTRVLNTAHYDTTTSYAYFPSADGIKSGMEYIDFSTPGTPVERGTCGKPGVEPTIALYVHNTTEAYAFMGNATGSGAIRCEFSNPTNPTYVNESNINARIGYYKQYNGIFANKLYATITNTAGTSAYAVRAITGFTGSTNATSNVTCGDGIVDAGESCDAGGSNGACPATCSLSCTVNACTTTTNTITKLGEYTRRSATDIYRDLTLQSSIVSIVGGSTLTNGTVTSVDVGNPSLMNESTSSRVYQMVNPIRGVVTGYGITSSPSAIIAVGADTMFQISPAAAAVTGAGSSGIFDHASNPNYPYYIFEDVVTIKDSEYLGVLYNWQPTALRSEFVLYNHTSGNSSDYDNSSVFSFENNDCPTMLYDPGSRVFWLDCRTNGIRAHNYTSPHNGSVSASFSPVVSGLTAAHDLLAYDNTTKHLIEAGDANGIRIINMTDPLNIITSYIKLGDCSPGPDTITTAVDIASPGIYAGVGYSTTGSNQPFLFLCNASQSYTTPQAIYNITTLIPVGLTVSNGVYYVLGYNTLGAYSTSSSTTNATPPVVSGTATLQATVTDATSGAPIEGAVVYLLNTLTGDSVEIAFTNFAGVAIITNIPDSSYLLTISKTGYTTYQATVSAGIFTSNAVVPLSFTLSTDVLPPISGTNSTGFTTTGQACEDNIKGVWLCGMTNTSCTQNSDCVSGMCEGTGFCSAFNWRLCDQAGRPRNQACFINYTTQGSFRGIFNWMLHNFGYVLILVIFLILFLTIKSHFPNKK